VTAAALDLGSARRHAEETVRRSGTSFGAGMAILPKRRREAMHAIYAFCREVDDIADDNDLTRDERKRRLEEWRAEIDRLYEGRPQFPSGLALLEPVRAFGLEKREFLMVIEGMEMDADGPIVAPSMDKLLAYTRRVAGAVGKLSMPVFGAPAGEASDRFALSLGDALQLTNILRDVAEDAGLGRLYLPAELLEKHGAPMDPASLFRPAQSLRDSSSINGGAQSEASPLSSLARGVGGEPSEPEGGRALQAVARELGALAKRKFADARAALKDLDWRTVRPALLMMGVYEAYLKKLEARGWEKVGEPLSLSKAQKILIAARYAIAPPL